MESLRSGLMNCADPDRDGGNQRQGGLLGTALSTDDLRRNNFKEPGLEGANLATRPSCSETVLEPDSETERSQEARQESAGGSRATSTKRCLMTWPASFLALFLGVAPSSLSSFLL